MSDLLSIGASGVRAYGTALAAIGNNVSNASTAGYSRRTVSTSEAITGSSGLSQATVFNGVASTSVGRAGDDYLTANARTTASDAASASALNTWLTNAQTALNDGTTGVGQSATAVFTAGSALAGDPSSTANQQSFMSALQQTATAFNTTASSLATVSQGIATTAETTAQSVNTDIASLNKVNAALRQTQPGTSAQADLLDQRDSLLNNIAGNVGIDVTTAADGSATVKLTGSGVQLTKTAGVSNSGAQLTTTVGNNGLLSVQAVSSGQVQAVNSVGGTLGGLVESASTVADRRDQLDTMAANFTSAINSWQAQGTTSSGATGSALLSGTTASTISVTTSDPTAIASASGTTANGNLLTLSNLRGSSGLETSWSNMVTDQGQLVSSAGSASTAASAIADAAATSRDNASSVDLDTEAAELIRYQQAYSGAAKVISVAQATMQSIFDLF